MQRQCPICGGQLERAKVRVAVNGYPVGNYDGYKCSNCSEEFMAEKSMEPAHEEIVRAGLFGLMKQAPAIPSPDLFTFTISRTGTAGHAVRSVSDVVFGSVSESRSPREVIAYSPARPANPS